MKSTRFTFNNIDEELETIQTIGIKSLDSMTPENKCSLMNSKIRTIGEKETNEGIFDITFDAFGEGRYIVKKTLSDFELIRMTKTELLSALKNYSLTWQKIKKFQSRDTIDDFEKNNENESVYIIPKKTCSNDKCSPDIIDYAISLILAQYYQNKQIINFYSVFSMNTCISQTESKIFRYVFTDKFDGNILTFKDCLKLGVNKHKIIDGLYIQILFSIAFYQNLLISHNNLNTSTVNVVVITERTMFNFKRLILTDWFHYKTKEKDIYLETIPLIVKIANFEKADKYSKPAFGNRENKTINKLIDSKSITESISKIYSTPLIKKCLKLAETNDAQSILGMLPKKYYEKPEIGTISTLGMQ